MLLAQQILNGLLDGVYYLLIALGLSLIFSARRIVISRWRVLCDRRLLTLVISPYLGFGGAFVAARWRCAVGVVIERTQSAASIALIRSSRCC